MCPPSTPDSPPAWEPVPAGGGCTSFIAFKTLLTEHRVKEVLGVGCEVTALVQAFPTVLILTVFTCKTVYCLSLPLYYKLYEGSDYF